MRIDILILKVEGRRVRKQALGLVRCIVHRPEEAIDIEVQEGTQTISLRLNTL